MGPHLFKQFRWTENNLKQQPHILTRQEEYEFRCVEWKDEECFVGYAGGEILCYEGSELVWSHRSQSSVSIESICKSSNVRSERQHLYSPSFRDFSLV